MKMTIILKALFLFLAIIYGFGNIGRLRYNQRISGVQMFLMTIGIVGFIVLQFWV